MFQFERIVHEAQASSRSTPFKFDVPPKVKNSFIKSLVAKYSCLAIVSDSFINDSFNLYGISDSVENYAAGLQVLKEDIYDTETGLSEEEINQAAYEVYALVHARFILTPSGLDVMKRKYESGIFGICPRFCCEGQHLLPAGITSELGYKTITYCPRCRDLYTTNIDLDGAFFGPAFPHFFEQNNREIYKLRFQSQYPLLSFNGIPIDSSGSFCPQRLVRNSELA